MSKKIKNTIIISSAIIAFLTILILGTIFDLNISKALADLTPGQYHSQNLFAILGEAFGENILYIFIVVACGILFFYLINFSLNKKWLNILCLILLASFSALVCFYCLHKTASYLAIYTSFGLDKYLASVLGKLTLILLSVAIDLLAFLLLSKLKKETLSSLYKWALAILVVFLLSNGFVQITKRIIDRTRYRAMFFVDDTNFQYYTNWFAINKNKFNSVSIYADDFFKSFPSGHTCAAASSFCLVLLPLFLQNTNNKKWKITFWTFAICYTTLVGLSRIVAGAHFFTDVFIGAMSTIFLILILYFTIKKQQDKPAYKCERQKTRTGC